MNDLLQTMAVASAPGSQWPGSTDNLDDGPAARDAGVVSSSRRGGQRMKELAFSTNAIDCTALTLPTAGRSRAKNRLQVKGEKTPTYSIVGRKRVLGFRLGFSLLPQIISLARMLPLLQTILRVKVRGTKVVRLRSISI